jgi:hypothetical protein
MITEAGDILGLLQASRTVVATVPGIVAAYVLTPTIGPDALKLPAAMQHVAIDDVEPTEISYTASQEQVDHRFVLDVLVKRSVDLRADQEAAMPFIPLVLKAYRENAKLGEPIVQYCQPINERMLTVTLGKETYFAIRFQMAAKLKQGVTIN